MGAQAHTRRRDNVAHFVENGFECVEVNDQSRGVDLGERGVNIDTVTHLDHPYFVQLQYSLLPEAGPARVENAVSRVSCSLKQCVHGACTAFYCGQPVKAFITHWLWLEACTFGEKASRDFF